MWVLCVQTHDKETDRKTVHVDREIVVMGPVLPQRDGQEGKREGKSSIEVSATCMLTSMSTMYSISH